MVKVKLLLVCISLMSLYEISDVLNFKAGDKSCRFNKALLNGAWGIPEEENALFFIKEDSMFYVEHFENGYPVQLNECMLNIFYEDYMFKGHLLKLSEDSLVYQAEGKTIRLYRRDEDSGNDNLNNSDCRMYLSDDKFQNRDTKLSLDLTKCILNKDVETSKYTSAEIILTNRYLTYQIYVTKLNCKAGGGCADYFISVLDKNFKVIDSKLLGKDEVEGEQNISLNDFFLDKGNLRFNVLTEFYDEKIDDYIEQEQFIDVFVDNGRLHFNKKETSILQDSCINHISIGNPNNVMENYGDLSSQLIFEQNKFPHVQILNQSKKECLEVSAWNGDGKNTFRYFKVYFNDKDLIKNSIHSQDISFISCLGVKLGATKGDVLHTLGKPSDVSCQNGIDQIEYSQELYKAKYKFKDDRLIEFEFGEIYP